MEQNESTISSLRRNVIPRKFNKIVGEMLINTNTNNRGDLVEVFRDDFGCHMRNMRTGEIAWANLSIIRTPKLFKFKEVK